jgi:hypothetical protein
MLDLVWVIAMAEGEVRALDVVTEAMEEVFG